MGIKKYKTKTGKTRYGVNVFDKSSGKTRWIGTYKNADDAKLAFSDADRRNRLGEILERKDIEFDKLVDTYLERIAVQEKTRNEYRNTLAPARTAWQSRNTRSLTKEDVEELIASRTAFGVHPRQVIKLRTRLSQVMNAAIDWGYLATSPCAGRIRSLPRMPDSSFRPLLDDEVQAVIEATPDWWRPAVMTCLASGLRQGELFGLQVNDVDLEASTITVRGQLQDGQIQRTKTSAGMRTVPIPEIVASVLREHIARLPDMDVPLLFPTQRGCPVSKSNWCRRVWRPTVVASGVRTDLKMHDLRKQFASVMVRQGRSVAYLQSVMGHRSPTTTLKWYVGKFDDESEQAMKDMNDWLCHEDPPTHSVAVLRNTEDVDADAA